MTNPDTAFAAVIVIAMFFARAGKSMVESDGYVGMLRAFGALLMVMAIVAVVVMLFGQ